jgi:hypothetical protein
MVRYIEMPNERALPLEGKANDIYVKPQLAS